MSAWTDAEIETFTRRSRVLQKIGLSAMEAEQTAETMMHRDRPESGDDRRLCLECASLKKGRCTRRGYMALPTVLQRCDGFSLRGADARHD